MAAMKPPTNEDAKMNATLNLTASNRPTDLVTLREVLEVARAVTKAATAALMEAWRVISTVVLDWETGAIYRAAQAAEVAALAAEDAAWLAYTTAYKASRRTDVW